jgi:hypothetical protein
LVLFAVLVAVLVANLRGLSGRSAADRPAAASAAALPSDVRIPWPVPEAYPDTLRDPMQYGRSRSRAEAAGARHLMLTGILYSRQKPSAVVDGTIVHEGDTVEGVKVIRINKSSVEFEAAGSSWTQGVRQPAPPAGTGKERL